MDEKDAYGSRHAVNTCRFDTRFTNRPINYKLRRFSGLKAKLFLQVMNVRATCLEIGIVQNVFMQINIGINAGNADFIQRALHSGNGYIAGGTVGN